ncbi:bifunctional DNA primase/polymerase [Nocardiopsis sp. NPDC006938]|uniref:bifunctional DNA primase/polymerase n=1 Tax=Nocardiopsis sp. NPDC006938 TaxID=3364337 RepID=UPI003682D6CD
MTDTMTASEVAVGVARCGWAVMPLTGKGPVRNCSPCRRDRHHGADCECTRTPGRWCHGFYSAIVDVEVLERHWPHAADGVGIATGASNLVVVDVDGPQGHEWVTGLARRGVLPPTLMMRSSSGEGYHLYYEGTLRSRPLRLAPTHPLAGTADDIPVDIKSQGSYVRWTGTVATDRPLAPVPVALEDELQARQARLDASTRRPEPTGPAPAATGRCTHAPGYLDRGVQMAVEQLSHLDPSGGGVHAQVYGVLRGIVRRHAGTCGRDCATGEQLHALAEAAGRLGERPGDFERAWDNALVESGLPVRFGTRTVR